MNLLPVNTVIQGDASKILQQFPDKSVDLIFADPPYNLQLRGSLWRPNLTLVDAVDDDWDDIGGFEEYDAFTKIWLSACKRVLKDDGSIWVIGSYHNIFRIGALMQDMGFWLLNDVVWVKTNPTPNFHGTRFTNAHETLIWASKSEIAKYTFNYKAMKSLNEDLQMRSDWLLPICTGPERLKVDGRKAHSTQKPESLLYRIIIASTNPGDVILDPFFGTGTTGAVAKRLKRNWIGIEQDEDYVNLAAERIDKVTPSSFDERLYDVRTPRQLTSRIPFGQLVELGLLSPGQELFFQSKMEKKAIVKADGKLLYGETTGSIHTIGRLLMNQNPCNGWSVWFYYDETGTLRPIDYLRVELRKKITGHTDLE